MRYIAGMIFISLLLGSCKGRNGDPGNYNRSDLDDVNVGQVRLYADAGAEYLLEQLGDIYTASFPKAAIDPVYTSEANVLKAIENDSVRLIVLQRELTQNELDRILLRYEAKPIQHVFAYDAIALVRSAEDQVKVIDSLQLAAWITQAKDVFVTTQEHVNLFSLLLRKYSVMEGARPLKIVNNLDELKQFLATHKDYVGLLPFSLVSDQYSPRAREITARFSWLGIKGSGEPVYPSQSTIFTKEWPLTTPYTITYCRLAGNKGVGFVKFVHNRQASKLIVKAGLIPVNMPQRDIKVEPQSFDL